MPVSDFLPFATIAGANVETQAEFAGDPALGSGYDTGRVYSRRVNKLWRQSSFISAAVARVMVEQLNQDVLDNGDLTTFTNKLTQAISSISSVVAEAGFLALTGGQINGDLTVTGKITTSASVITKLSADPTTAPGAGKAILYVVAGANGTATLRMMAGTSTTPVNVAVNVGTGF
jgi:hypothetical protein